MPMKRKSTDLNLFKVFVAIYQQRNLTRAADMLSITQPAVSNALNRLRSNFDDQLFVRSHHGMNPTPFAESIVDRVQEALHLLDSSLSIGEDFSPKTTRRTFNISMNDISESMILPKVMKAFHAQAPMAKLECYYVSRGDVEKELSTGNIDLAIDVKVVSTTTQVISEVLNSEDYVCALREDHPFTNEKMNLEEYLKLDHMVISSRRKGISYEDTALKSLGHKRNVALRIPYYNVAPQILNECDLCATMPRQLAEHFELKTFELPFALKPIDWRMYWHKNSKNDRGNIWLRELLVSCVK